jgi:hypothetical protein
MVPTLDINIQRALQKQQAFEQWLQDPKALMQFMQGQKQVMDQYQGQMQQAEAKFKVDAAAAKVSEDQPVPTFQAPPPPPPPTEMTPLKWLPWYNPEIHMQEFIKWANGDSISQLLQKFPFAVSILQAHMQEIQGAMPKPQPEQKAPTMSFAFTDQSLGDPQVRAVFDQLTGQPVENLPAVQKTAVAKPNSQPGQPDPKGSKGGPKAQGGHGAASSMKGSNRESGEAPKPSA